MGKKSKLHELQFTYVKRRCEYQIEKIFFLTEILNLIHTQDPSDVRSSSKNVFGAIEMIQNQIDDRCYRMKRILEESENSNKRSK